MFSMSTTVSEDGGREMEIKARLMEENKCYCALQGLKSSLLVLIYKAKKIRSVALYGAETLTF